MAGGGVARNKWGRVFKDEGEIKVNEWGGGGFVVDFCIAGWGTEEESFTRPWGVGWDRAAAEEEEEEEVNEGEGEGEEPRELKKEPLDVKKTLRRYYEAVNPQKLDEEQEDEDRGEAYLDVVLDKWKEASYRALYNGLKEKYGVDPEDLTAHMRSGLCDFAPSTQLNLQVPSIVLRSLGIEGAPTHLGVVKYQDVARGGPFDWKLMRPFTAHETVTFEREVIAGVSNDKLVKEMGKLIAEQGSKEALKHTIAASLMTTLAVPIAVGNAVNGIDDDWALACKRSDRVGVLLARGWCENGAGDVAEEGDGKVKGEGDEVKAMTEVRERELQSHELKRRVRGRLKSSTDTFI